MTAEPSRSAGKWASSSSPAALPEHIKAREAVRLFAKWNRAPADPATLDALGIPAFADAQYRQLSTGQKRRLHLALALIREPDILFLDEPSAGLDVEGRLALHGLIRRWKEAGKTIVLASHDMAEVEALCDRLAILSGGRDRVYRDCRAAQPGGGDAGTVLRSGRRPGRRPTPRRISGRPCSRCWWGIKKKGSGFWTCRWTAAPWSST